MKSFFTAFIIAVIIVFGTFFYTHNIEIISEKLLADNRAVISCIKNNEYETAYNLAKNMENYMNETKISLAIIMDHSDLDKIESGIAELESYILSQIKADSLAKCNALDVLIRHMPKNYKLKIENVL